MITGVALTTELHLTRESVMITGVALTTELHLTRESVMITGVALTCLVVRAELDRGWLDIHHDLRPHQMNLWTHGHRRL